MDESVNKIVVIRGAPSATIQPLLRTLADRWVRYARVAGVVAEDHGLADRPCSAGFLRNIGTDEWFPIFRDPGPGSTVCHLDGSGARSATAAVQREIATGCDVVILSKFGKLEAAGEGLFAAFTSAIDAGIPLLTAVSPAFDAAWTNLVPSFTVVPADIGEIEAWWRAITSSRKSPSERNLRV
jgi:hypothetical protein